MALAKLLGRFCIRHNTKLFFSVRTLLTDLEVRTSIVSRVGPLTTTRLFVRGWLAAISKALAIFEMQHFDTSFQFNA